MKNQIWMLAALSACCLCITIDSCSRKGEEFSTVNATKIEE